MLYDLAQFRLTTEKCWIKKFSETSIKNIPNFLLTANVSCTSYCLGGRFQQKSKSCGAPILFISGWMICLLFKDKEGAHFDDMKVNKIVGPKIIPQYEYQSCFELCLDVGIIIWLSKKTILEGTIMIFKMKKFYYNILFYSYKNPLNSDFSFRFLSECCQNLLLCFSRILFWCLC